MRIASLTLLRLRTEIEIVDHPGTSTQPQTFQVRLESLGLDVIPLDTFAIVSTGLVGNWLSLADDACTTFLRSLLSSQEYFLLPSALLQVHEEEQ